MTLHARSVSWRRGGALVVDDVSLTPQPGRMVGLLGPNGSGKSSLLRLLQGVSRPDAGTVLLDGEPLHEQGRRAVARKVAAVTQHAETDTDITVHDVVRLGRAVAAGPPAEVLTPQLIREVYEVDAEVSCDPATGRVAVSYLVPAREAPTAR